MLSIISPSTNIVYESAENKVYRLTIDVIYFNYYEYACRLYKVLTIVERNGNYELLYKTSMNI